MRGAMREEMPGEEVLESLRRLEDDMAYVAQEFPALGRKYLNHVVAIRDRRVLAHAGSMRALISELKAQGLDPRDIYITSFPPEDAAFIL